MLISSHGAPGHPRILHCTDLPDEQRFKRHGKGEYCVHDALHVNELTTVRFEFLIGEMPVETGGELLIVWRWPFDWGDLQTVDPTAEGFLSVRCEHAGDRTDDEPVQLRTRYHWITGIEPWHHQIQVGLVSGRLQQADRIVIVAGDASVGSAGWRASTCATDRCEFLMLVDHKGQGERVRLVQQPSFRIRAGDAAFLKIEAPSNVRSADPFRIIVRADDCWGNPTNPGHPIELACEGMDAKAAGLRSVETHESRSTQFEARLSEAGDYQFRAVCGSLEAVSASVRIDAGDSRPMLFWGDLHSGQSRIGCGNGTLEQHFRFARDEAGLQFCSHQANDHYVTLEDWHTTQRVTEAMHEEHRFVTLLGCEWSALTKDGGDRNVFYRDSAPPLHRSDRFFVEEPVDGTADARTAPQFHRISRERDILVNLHVGGRMSNLEWHDPRTERLCELHSTHGTVEWFFREALAKGYQVGATAGTDGVMGRPGACRPGRRLIRNSRNGLTAVYADELTRSALWKSLQRRFCYATTGERIRLWFEVNEMPMGSEVATTGKRICKIEVDGTGPIERVDLMRDTECIESWQPTSRMEASSGHLRVLWGGTQRRGTARLQRVQWNGQLEIDRGALKILGAVNPQSLEDRATQTHPRGVQWNWSTAGELAGLELLVNAGAASELTFRSVVQQFRCRIEDVLSSERTWDAGGLDRRIIIGPAPRADGPSSFHIVCEDENPLHRSAAYWVRICQTNQAMAWSSPVFVRNPRGER